MLAQVEIERNLMVLHSVCDEAYDISFPRCQSSHSARLLNLQGTHRDHQLQEKFQFKVADPDLPLVNLADELWQCVEGTAAAENASRTASKGVDDEIAFCGIQQNHGGRAS